MNRTMVGSILLVGVGIVAGVMLTRQTPLVASKPVEPMRPMPESFADIAEKARGSVVHITTKARGFADLPILEQSGIGSGVLISRQGHILTNHHVIRGGRDFKVLFDDGVVYAGTVVGDDPETDLGLLKIELPKDSPLTPIVFADSEKVRIGDWAIAIGSPFGYSHTVTAGIVSAKQRRARQDIPYQDFIQTDAAINPGNSGGALLNIRGELVGINTMIVSPHAASDGVGFAISSNLCKFVSDRLLKDGKVRRGFLGVGLHDIDDDLVGELKDPKVTTLVDLMKGLGLKDRSGVYLLRVEAGSGADKAGLKVGDVVVELGGKPVRNQIELFSGVAQVDPGQKIDVAYLRDGKRLSATATLGERAAK